MVYQLMFLIYQQLMYIGQEEEVVQDILQQAREMEGLEEEVREQKHSLQPLLEHQGHPVIAQLLV